MSFKLLTLAAVCLAGSSLALQCNDGKVRGVNLGGYLLLEPWITARMFEEINVNYNNEVVDEYTMALLMDPQERMDILRDHWENFYTQEDFAKLVSVGISHIRVPVGYWMFDVPEGEPFPPAPLDGVDQKFYLKRIFQWAEEAGLKVLLDLHGAPGSQNGFDNSGKRGDIEWYVENSNDQTNPDFTVHVLELASQLLVDWIQEGAFSEDTLFGIELLNEPAGFFEYLWIECRDYFYPKGHDSVRTILTDRIKHKVVFQQAFVSPSEFHDYFAEEGESVALDNHEYHAFGDYWNSIVEGPDGWPINLAASCEYASNQIFATMPSYVGEWSLAITECQKYLNGGYMVPYVTQDASPETCAYYNSDWSTYSDYYKDFLRNFMAAQMDAYEAGGSTGYFFWTSKTQDSCAPEWDFLFLIDNGIVPSNLCERPRYC